jgi:electron transfer flavoprotein beta subunit
VRVKADQSGVELANVKMAMNPFDEIAVEQAIRFKEAGAADEVVAISIGPDQAQETIRTALAMGADRGIHVQASHDTEPLAIAKVIKAITDKENPGLILMGKQAIDDDSNQTGQMLATLLGWPQATFASGVELDGNSLKIIREVDSGLEHITCPMPAVVTVDLRLNEPRYASLPNIMKAKKKPIDQISLEDLGVDASQRLKTIKVEEPPARQAGIIVDSVDTLVEKLTNEAKVI